MQWRIELADGEAHAARAWIERFLADFDTSALAWVRIDHGGTRKRGVYGCCRHPSGKQKAYRVSCHVPGPFPCRITTRRPPLYPDARGRFPPVPRGCERGAYCVDRRSGRRWYRLRGRTRLRDLDEAVAWLFAHEAFHFLRRTRQVRGRDTEIDADGFADARLAAFREARRAQPRAAALSA
jgi:hypothetical protein